MLINWDLDHTAMQEIYLRIFTLLASASSYSVEKGSCFEKLSAVCDSYSRGIIWGLKTPYISVTWQHRSPFIVLMTMNYSLYIGSDYIRTVEVRDPYDDTEIFEIMESELKDLCRDKIDDVTTEIVAEEVFSGDPASLNEEMEAWYLKTIGALEIQFGKDFLVNLQSEGDLYVSHKFPVEFVMECIGTSEEGMIHDGKLALELVEKFLANGVWQSGLRTKSGSLELIKSDQRENREQYRKLLEGEVEPVIWFGIAGKEPIRCWSIERIDFDELRDRSAFLGGDNTVDWSIMFGPGAEVILTWLFYECGFDEPETEYEKLCDTCPIELVLNSTTKKFHEAFDRHFASLFQA